MHTSHPSLTIHLSRFHIITHGRTTSSLSGVVVAGWGGGGATEDEERLEADTRLSRASVLKVAGPRLRSSLLGLVMALGFSPGRPMVKGMRLR
jgi:hypothetical protein